MITKKELINEIKKLSKDENLLEEIKSMNKEELEQTLDYVTKLNEFVEKEKELVFIDEDQIEEVISDENQIEEVIPDEVVEEQPAIEYVKYKNISELGKSELRMYQRTGILPEKKK